MVSNSRALYKLIFDEFEKCQALKKVAWRLALPINTGRTLPIKSRRGAQAAHPGRLDPGMCAMSRTACAGDGWLPERLSPAPKNCAPPTAQPVAAGCGGVWQRGRRTAWAVQTEVGMNALLNDLCGLA